MKKRLEKASVGALGMSLLLPDAVLAHPGHGHGGEHGWLMGALQPFLSLDHLAAGVFVLGVGTIGLVVLGRRAGEGARDQ